MWAYVKISASLATDAARTTASILEDDDLDSLLLTHDRNFVRLLAKARERVRAGQFLTNEQFWRELRRRRTPRSPSSRRTRTTRQ